MPAKPLNWKEIALIADVIRPELEGLFVDRIIVPERARFPAGYLKGEWSIRLTGRRNEGSFLFSVRTRQTYFAFIPGRGARAAPLGTRSAFDLELSKRLKGARLTRVEAVARERTLILWFADPGLALVLNLIPATPEALLVRGVPGGKSYPIVLRSRANREAGGAYALPDGALAPIDPPVRPDLNQVGALIEQDLAEEAFTTRLVAAQRMLRELAKQCRDRLRQTETAIREAESDADWQSYGDLLKSFLHEDPPLEAVGSKWVRRVQPFHSEEEAPREWVALPADPKLSASAQVKKYYQLAQRKSRRISEARTRREGLSETLVRLDGLLAEKPAWGDFKAIERLERAGGAVEAPVPGKSARKGAWLGKTFTSRDGLTIFVGRSKDENLDLTFKHARGNDIWMHVRGRPGAHVLIPLQPSKSAPLETLLDGALLAVYYSKGESWGKTEVDYTFKKYVKRIKDSSEASYVNNKTLIVEQDAARLKRLLAKDE